MRFFKKKQKKKDEDKGSIYSNAVNESLRSNAVHHSQNNMGDTMHQISADFGYPDEITIDIARNMYRRSGIAGAVIELLPDSCWTTPPKILGSDQFNNDLERLAKKTNLWQRLKGADIRQRVGRYSAIFMRVRDGLTPENEIGQLNGIGSLVDLIPLYEDQITVVEKDRDVMSDNYNRPIMYEMTTENGNTVKIHHSRVIIASEGADDGTIYGISCLERPFNALMDITKIIGAGGEGFYRNAAQAMILELMDGAVSSKNKEVLDSLSENVTNFLRKRMRGAFWIPGMKAKTLESSLANPKEFLMNALYDVSASTKLPVTILIGQLTGRLASQEDGIRLLSQAKSRQSSFLTEFTESVINWFILNRILPASDYSIEWDDLMTMSESDNLDNIEKMANINHKQFQSMGEAVFTSEEMRQLGGYEAESLPMPDETLPDDIQ